MKRVKQTLEGFEQVQSVEFISEKEHFEVTYRAEIPMGEVFRDSVKEIIIFPEMRKFLGGLGSKLNNSTDVGP